MDRDDVIRISKSATFGGLTISDINMVLMQYCMEQGKPYNEAASFVTHVLGSRQVSYYFSVALEYYEKKFAICKLWGAPNPLNNREERKLLQIF